MKPSFVSRLAAAVFLLAGALAARADVYVADTSAAKIFTYSAVNAATVFDQGLTSPNPLLVDAAGNLYVGENGTGTIYKYAPGGGRSVVLTIANDAFFGFVFDAAGNFFVSAYDTVAAVGSILKVAPDGTQSTFATGLTRVRGMVFDGAGNLYQADLDSGNVYKYTPAGVQSVFASGFNYPTGIAFDSKGNLFVCSQGVGVFEISPAGAVSTFTNDVTDPRYVAIDSSDDLYVTDVGDATGTQGQGNVYLFSPSGSRSTFASNLAFPTGIKLSPSAGFFSGEVALDNGVYYLQFPSGNPFGYYSDLTIPGYIYHDDLGYEYLFDANDGKAGVYLYDFTSGDFFYTSPSFPFPYLYDFTLNAVLYYYPDPNNPGRYNTNGVRYFYNYATGQTITR